MSVLNTTFDDFNLTIGDHYIIRVESSIIPGSRWKQRVLDLIITTEKELADQIKELWHQLYPLTLNIQVEAETLSSGYHVIVSDHDIEHLSFFLDAAPKDCIEMSKMISEYEAKKY